MQIAVPSKMTLTFSKPTCTCIPLDSDIHIQKFVNNKSEVNVSTFFSPTCATSVKYSKFITFENLTEVHTQMKLPPHQKFHMYIKNSSLAL